MDLLFFAAVAGYLIYRLYSILGEKEGFTKPQDESNVINLRGDRTSVKDLNDRFSGIRKFDPGFDEKFFSQGVSSAFVMIVKAYHSFDYNTLQNLLSAKLYKDFQQGMKEQESSDEVAETVVERVRSVDIESVSVKGSVAQLSTKIVSEQTNVVKDKAGKIIEGDEHQMEVVTDMWVFERDLLSDDPTWKLIETATIEDE